jgi:MFS family permease
MNLSALDTIQLRRNIPRYFAYTVFKGIGFGLFLAMWVIDLQQRRGLSLAQAALVDTTFFVAAALAEVPTGIVADTWGRKTSLAIGAALIAFSVVAWALAPTLPLILLAYLGMAVGTTFLSGAEEALFFETLQRLERTEDYPRLVGRVSATATGAMALGSVVSGWLATMGLIVPFLAAGLSIFIMFGLVLTLKEPPVTAPSSGEVRPTFREIVRRSFAMVRTRPTVGHAVLYLALIPMAAFMLESLFIQPQSVSLGIPIAGIGVIVMALQLVGAAGSSASGWVRERFGERRVLALAPLLIVMSLIALAFWQVRPALILIALIGGITSLLRPIMMGRLQNEVPDDIRATLLSMQSMLFTVVAAVAQPSLGLIADRGGLPAAYLVLAGSLGILIVVLRARRRVQVAGQQLALNVGTD